MLNISGIDRSQAYSPIQEVQRSYNGLVYYNRPNQSMELAGTFSKRAGTGSASQSQEPRRKYAHYQHLSQNSNEVPQEVFYASNQHVEL